MEIIHLTWNEHEWNEDEILNNFNSNEDYGIYQIYGDHPVYGDNTLLYIGKAQDQRYSTRLKQHLDGDFLYTHISTFRKIHLSYICVTEDVDKNKWKNYIGLVEKLLINAHFPAYNSQDIKNIIKKNEFKNNVLVLNWDYRGKLLPEVSSLRYSDYYWNKRNLNTEKIFKDE